jgi:hypothetical protein
MLSFNHIGNLGRLGNQMFQYASLKGIAKYRDYEYSIPPKEVFGNIDNNVKRSECNLHDVFDLEKEKIGLIKNPTLPERMHEFDEDLFVNFPDNVDLFGYYQSEKYFKHIENEIRKDFSFKEDLFDMCKNVINGDEVVISLHIRRGDYITNNNHPVQDIEYYEKALSKFDNYPVIVFSDDPEWCKNKNIFSSDRFLISENNTTDFDLCLMSLCDYHIIANSSFSWWGAWLAKSKQVIAPKKWFGGECVNKNVKDMPFGNWIWL